MANPLDAGSAEPPDPTGARSPSQPGIWDAGLQPERTKLAWQRTVLSVLACSLVVSRLVALDHLAAGVGCALASILLAGLAGRRTTTRYRRTAGALRGNHALPDGRLAGWLVVHLMALAAFAVLYALS